MTKDLMRDVRDIIVSEGLRNKRISEAFLVRKLGVSRTSVREVLKHLEEEGLIVRLQGAGIRLKEASLSEVIEIYDIRILLEGLAIRYLADNLDDSILKKLVEASKDFNEAKKSKDEEKIVAAETRFHQIIIDHCQSKRLAMIIANLQLITRSFHAINRVSKLARCKKVIYPHEKIIAALKSGDSKKAEKLLKLHIEEGKNTLIRLLLGPSINHVNEEQERND